MRMTIDDCIHKLDFSIGAYQRLIDENVSNGEVVGTGLEEHGQQVHHLIEPIQI